MSEEIKGKN